jgi:hypothetical protein
MRKAIGVMIQKDGGFQVRIGMAFVMALGISLLSLLSGGCGSGVTSGAGGAGGGKAFLDQKKEIGSHLEWNREVTSKSGGTITFRVDSQGPFGVTVVNDKGYKALQADKKKAFSKEDVLLTADSKEPSYDGKVTLPPGSSWFIIENRMDKNAEIHLQCFAP